MYILIILQYIYYFASSYKEIVLQIWFWLFTLNQILCKAFDWLLRILTGVVKVWKLEVNLQVSGHHIIWLCCDCLLCAVHSRCQLIDCCVSLTLSWLIYVWSLIVNLAFNPGSQQSLIDKFFPIQYERSPSWSHLLSWSLDWIIMIIIMIEFLQWNKSKFMQQQLKGKMRL